MRTTLLSMIAIMILALTPTHTAKGVDTDCVLTQEANDNGKKKKKLPFTEGLRAVEKEGKDSFALWVNSKLIYPESARQNKLQGKVHLTFIIDTDGFPKDIKVKKAITKISARKLKRVVYSSPRWQPALCQGKPYKVRFTFPVIFKLK